MFQQTLVLLFYTMSYNELLQLRFVISIIIDILL